MKNKTQENSLKSKEMYKVTLGLLKILPMVMVFSYLLMLCCYYYCPSYVVLPHLLGTVGAPISFIYITSYVFKFCAFHRVFIHYYAFINILNVTHHYFAHVFNPDVVTFIHEIGTLIFAITAIIMYIYKYKKYRCVKILNSLNCTDSIE